MISYVGTSCKTCNGLHRYLGTHSGGGNIVECEAVPRGVLAYMVPSDLFKGSQ